MKPDESPRYEFGTKTIGFWGGVMLLINNMAGPTISLMPALAQESGWLSMVVVMIVIAMVSALCGWMLLEAIRGMPNNENFHLRIEFTDLFRYYISPPFDSLIMLVYHAYLVLNLMTYIIQSGQVIDYMMLDSFGCAPGLQFRSTFENLLVCGTVVGDITPFGQISVLSSSMIIVAIICIPFALWNLDDNICLQFVAIFGLTFMAIVWIVVLARQPTFPQTLPAMTSDQGTMIGTLLFNFAFMSSLPSWANEKQADVSVPQSFVLSLGYVVVVYTVIGVIGGLAFQPFYTTDQNLFSKLNDSGWWVARATVAAYPILQNFTSIPVLAIFIRYNLQSSGLGKLTSISLAFGLPWCLSVHFYTGQGFTQIASFGGLCTSLIINFIVPILVYGLHRKNLDALSDSEDSESLCSLE